MVIFIIIAERVYTLGLAMELTSRLRAIIFDMDGLMFDTERIAQDAWQQAARDFGYDFPLELYTGIVGLALTDVEHFTRQTFGADYPFELIYPRKQAYVDRHIASRGIPLKPGLLELLADIEGAGLAKALASSSGTAIIQRNLTSAGLNGGRFEAIVGGDEIQRGKPAPDIFLVTSQRLQIPAENCLVLEDSNAGIQAAHAAGMHSIMVPDMLAPTPESQERAYQILPDLKAVSRLLFPNAM
jgi:HAD superfamily hydrolase (TIGR01509 family)